jgi:hypothetical protein
MFSIAIGDQGDSLSIGRWADKRISGRLLEVPRAGISVVPDQWVPAGAVDSRGFQVFLFEGGRYLPHRLQKDLEFREF